MTGNQFFRYDIFGYSANATQPVSLCKYVIVVVAAVIGSNLVPGDLIWGINKILW